MVLSWYLIFYILKYNFHIAILFSIQLLYIPLHAQSASDSILLIRPDSTVVARLNQLDSIRQQTESNYASFKNRYDSIDQSASATQAKLQSKIVEAKFIK